MGLNIFSYKKELEARITTLVTDNEALVKKVAELEALTKTTISLEDHTKVLKERDEAVTEVSNLVKQCEEMDAKVKGVDALAATKAMEILASAGSPPVPSTPTDHPATMVADEAKWRNPRFAITEIK
jgi:hypothetical protein